MPPRHTTQMNDLLADQEISRYIGLSYTWTAPVPWVLRDPRTGRLRKGTDNHRAEGKLVGHMQRNDPLSRSELLDYLDLQRTPAYGHQGGEFNTNSHFPHWCRFGAMGLWLARQNRDAALVASFLEWWSRALWLMRETYVPVGPKRGSVIGWGARYRAGGDSDEQDATLALIDGRPTGKGDGYFQRALNERRRDTFPVVVVRELVRDGVFLGLLPTKPVSQYRVTITRHDNGHMCQCDNPKGKDPKTVWVRYNDGVVGTGPVNGMDLGAVMRESKL